MSEYQEAVQREIMISELHTGDKIKLKTGEVMEFVEMKRTKFTAMMDGKRYRVPVTLLETVLEKVDINKIKNEKKKESKSILSELKQGDWFYINKSGKALAFKFEKVEGNKIIGINPIDGIKSRIDISFEIGKIL
jgi:hypothetical protein